MTSDWEHCRTSFNMMTPTPGSPWPRSSARPRCSSGCRGWTAAAARRSASHGVTARPPPASSVPDLAPPSMPASARSVLVMLSSIAFSLPCHNFVGRIFVTCCLPQVAGMPSDLSRDIDECALHPDLCPHGECVDTRSYLHYLHHLYKLYLDYLLIISTPGRATTAAATQATRRQLTEAAATRTSVCR